MESLNVDDLMEFLKEKNIDDATISVLREQEVNGTAFLDLSQCDLIGLKIKMGPAKLLMRLINESIGNLQVIDEISIPSVVISDVVSLAQPVEKDPLEILSDPLPGPSVASEDSTKVVGTKESTSNASKFSKCNSVRATLAAHPQGKLVVEAADEGGDRFGSIQRCSMIRILVSELIKFHGSHYPPDEAKEALAATIVKEFPKLKNEGTLFSGHEHYFNKETKTGFLEYRLWTVRKSLSPSKKKYAGVKKTSKKVNSNPESTSGLLPSDELEEKKSWMKFTTPSEVHHRAIAECLIETMPNRRLWIAQNGPLLAEIFEEYPRLADFDCEMVDMEFMNMFKESSPKFLSRFATYFTPRILKCAMTKRPDCLATLSKAGVTDDNVKALLVLPELMPPPNFKKSGKTNKKAKSDLDGKACHSKHDFPNSDLIQIVEEGMNLEAAVSEKRMSANTNIQPYLLCSRNTTNDVYFVVADGKIFSVKNSNILTAFDVLFKLHYVCNVTFAPALSFFYNFIENFVYSMPKVTPQNTATALYVELTNISI